MVALETKTKNKRCRMDKKLKFREAMELGLCWCCDPTTQCRFKEVF
jgi:hypothetical protein